MHPVVKRILINGGLTAVVLGGLGFLFSQFAGMWATSEVKPGGENPNAILTESIRVKVPLMMAFWGFVFVVVAELLKWRLRGKPAVAKVTEPQPDAEKLLNELLAQAESKMALEAASKQPEDREQKTEDREQKTEEQKT
jgi:hypothetical protein